MGAPWRLTRHGKPCAPIAITNWRSRGYFDLKLGGGTELLTKTRSLEPKAMGAPFKRKKIAKIFLSRATAGGFVSESRPEIACSWL